MQKMIDEMNSVREESVQLANREVKAQSEVKQAKESSKKLEDRIFQLETKLKELRQENKDQHAKIGQLMQGLRLPDKELTVTNNQIITEISETQVLS